MSLAEDLASVAVCAALVFCALFYFVSATRAQEPFRDDNADAAYWTLAIMPFAPPLLSAAEEGWEALLSSRAVDPDADFAVHDLADWTPVPAPQVPRTAVRAAHDGCAAAMGMLPGPTDLLAGQTWRKSATAASWAWGSVSCFYTMGDPRGLCAEIWATATLNADKNKWMISVFDARSVGTISEALIHVRPAAV
jgi:hypothetical protein